MIWTRKNWNRLNQMLDEGIRGEFQETRYDETELSRVEAKWKRFLENLTMSRSNLEKEKDSIKSMISDISHQTKTPVANIRLYAELLEESIQKNGDASQADMIRQIQLQAEKLEFLIQSLTKMSRLESNIIELHPRTGPISVLIEEAADSILPSAGKKGITLVKDKREDFSAFYDLKWTEEALYNILDNAVKYSPRDSVIRISARQYEIYGAVSVSDEGIGIIPEEIPKLFGRFYRSNAVSCQEGVGIGLCLAREIIRKQRGYIKASPNEAVGSTFTIFLPLAE